MKFEYCLCLVAPTTDATAFGRGRAALIDAKKWERGSTLNVRFVETRSDDLHRRIRGAAEEWIDRAGINLGFAWVTSEPSDIRIGFSAAGSWSYLGTDANHYPNEATMNFGWLDDDTHDDDVRSVVLHEFGHALGLIHEHQHPEVVIPWKKDAVYDELMEKGWSKERIDQNFFLPVDPAEIETRGYDPRSIMHYPVPKRWTTDGTSVEANEDLSPGDIAVVQESYR